MSARACALYLTCLMVKTADFRYPRALDIGQVRSFSEDVSHMPEIKDGDVLKAFKELMAADWAALPSAVVNDAKNAVSKNTDDKEGQEALINVFRAAEAVEEFGGILTSLKMEIDDSIGMSGEVCCCCFTNHIFLALTFSSFVTECEELTRRYNQSAASCLS